jgi:hypothetical protein
VWLHAAYNLLSGRWLSWTYWSVSVQESKKLKLTVRQNNMRFQLLSTLWPVQLLSDTKAGLKLCNLPLFLTDWGICGKCQSRFRFYDTLQSPKVDHPALKVWPKISRRAKKYQKLLPKIGRRVKRFRKIPPKISRRSGLKPTSFSKFIQLCATCNKAAEYLFCETWLVLPTPPA